MIRIRLSAALGLLVLIVAGHARANDDGWELVGTEAGVTVSRKQVPGSSVIAFKGDGVVDAPIAKVASIVLDHDRASEWMDRLVESRVVRVVSPTEYVEYNKIGAPPMISDREFVADVKMSVDVDARRLTLRYESVEDGAVSGGSSVRGSVSSIFVLTSLDDGRRTRLTAELHADPKGALPAFVVNFFQKGWPVKAFEGLRRQARKNDITQPAAFAEVLAKLEQISR